MKNNDKASQDISIKGPLSGQKSSATQKDSYSVNKSLFNFDASMAMVLNLQDGRSRIEKAKQDVHLDNARQLKLSDPLSDLAFGSEFNQRTA